MIGYKVLTHDYRSPIQGGEPCATTAPHLADQCPCILDASGRVVRLCEAHLRQLLRRLFPRQASTL